MKKLIFSFLSLFVFAVVSKAQVIDSMLKVYANEFPQQKTYVHFDKELYRAGETVWFKAYLVSGFEPAHFSRSFFAELIDLNGNVVQRKTYPMYQASAAGSFDIPENTSSTKYRFRAYTTWMLNFDTSFIFQKDLVVSGKRGELAIKNTSAAAPGNTIGFFPEGGDLVEGLESVVAFKVTDKAGLPVKASGRILNQKGEVVTSFASQHNGMGTFDFTPQPNNVYKAEWTDNENKQYTTALPTIKQQGLVLKVLSGSDKKTFIVKRKTDAPANYKNLHVVGVFGQQVVYKARVPLSYEMNSGFIPVKDFPAGVLQITVFSEDWQPLAERIVMVNSNTNHLVNADLNNLSKDVGKRAKNVFEVQIPDTNLTNLSVSVTDAEIGKKERDNNIVSSLLITGELRGYVHNPAYYFSNSSDSVSKHLDLVMLSHGWRRYNWSDLAARKKPTLKYPNDNYLSINAKIMGLTSYTPIQPGEELMAILQMKDSSSQVMMLPKVGKDVFSAKGLVFYDTAKVYYQFSKDKKLSNQLAIQFDNGLPKGAPRIARDTLAFDLYSLDSSTVQRNRYFAGEVIKYASLFKTGGNVLETVTVRTRVKTPLQQLDEKYARGLFAGGDGFSFDMINDVRAQGSFNIFAFLQGQTPGLQISNAMGGGDPSVSWRGSQTSLFLDEMPVDASTLAGIPVPDIAYVKVLRPPFMGAFGGGAGGAIAVYTRKGGDVKSTPGKGLDMKTIVGYSSYKQFYSPDYSSKEINENTPSDLRTTLYWNPYIFLDATKQKAKIEFYNNDVSKAFKVVVEGMNELGQLVKIEKVIQ